MKSKRFISLSVLSLLSVGILSGVIFLNNSKYNYAEPVITEAWSTDVKPNVDATYYASVDGKTGTTLKTDLAKINKPTNKSYDWDRYEAADEAQDDSTSILCLYTRHNIKKSSHCGSYAWDKWNREHVYTQTAFPNSKTDNHNIFACEGEINNQRGNKKFANLKGKGGSQVIITYSGSSDKHVTDCYQTGSLFEPCDEAKGEVARACLYCTIYYGYDLTQIFDSVDTCLEWNANFTVTPREIYRNNIVYGLQGNRNPFTDHPSYAKAIYGGPDYQGTDPIAPSDPVAVTGVSLDKTEASVEIGKSIQLTATITPSDATNKKVTWSSSNTAIATVSSTGLVKGVAEGTANITVTTDDGDFTASCLVTVSEPQVIPVTSVSLNKSTASIEINKTVQLTATVAPSDATNKKVTWNSSDTAIATVSSNGLVTGLKEGTANITVTTEDGGFTATCSVNVTGSGIVHVTSISLDKTEVDLVIGQECTLVATINPDNATNKEVTWSSENKDIAKVNIYGKVTAKAVGTTTITVTTEDGGFTASCVIKVVAGGGSSSGCGGSITTTSVILSTLSILSVGLLLIKRKFIK